MAGVVMLSYTASQINALEKAGSAEPLKLCVKASADIL